MLILKKVIYDITIAYDSEHEIIPKYDIVLFYETLGHLLASDGLILRNISALLNYDGFLLGSVPNALLLAARLNMLLWRQNIYWPKDAIINGVFGGFGHIREYTYSEVKELLSRDFKIFNLYGYSPYGSNNIRKIWNILPKSWSSVIFFEARRKVETMGEIEKIQLK